MNFVEHYLLDIESRGYKPDPIQQAAVYQLAIVYDGLVTHKKKPWFSRGKPEAVKGLYLYGGVGRGKTYLMDLFFDALPFDDKKRLHFYHLMRYVHQQLEVNKGRKNPLNEIAKDFADQCRVLCLDEFFVSDIGDAMILGNFIKALFDNDVTLVCTSNIQPSELYKNGLQRQQFIPAIRLIEQNTVSHCLDSETDYRLLELQNVNRYFEGENADEALSDIVNQLFELRRGVKPSPITINNREINAVAKNNQVIWFRFSDLCGGPRSTQDYIDISHIYKTIIISEVPKFNNIDDLARRFISAIDEFYDQRIIVFISAVEPINNLYNSGRLHFEFERTKSRLFEMQTTQYNEVK